MIIQRQDPAIKTINPTLVKVGEAVHDAILDYHILVLKNGETAPEVIRHWRAANGDFEGL